MRVYYNEHDRFAAAWLRELMVEGLIPVGDVDERDIQDINPKDLIGYKQCHFFTGIGGWSRALQIARWPVDREVWSGSPPCQPFSAAGRGLGVADERHLWPAFFHLLQQRRPETVFGEQVASKDGLAWLDLVSSDLEGAGYACGAADLCAAGVGAPHIRQRLWWVGVANADQQRHNWSWARGAGRHEPADRGHHGTLALADRVGAGLSVRQRQDVRGAGRGEEGRAVEQRGRPPALGLGVAAGSGRAGFGAEPEHVEPGPPSPAAGGLADADGGDTGTERQQRGGQHGQQPQDGGAGFWASLLWLPCRDGKARPTEPSIQPLAHGVRNRVGLLRGAGNAIVPEVGAQWVEAVMEQLASVASA